jgi:hypothetical protein
MLQRLVPLSILLLGTLAGCSSTPWSNDSARVDDAYLARVDSADRSEIANLRSERAEMSDDLAFAERRIDEEEARKDVAEQEVDVAEQEVARAKARLDVTRKSGNPGEDVQDELDAARAHVRWAEAQVTYHDLRIRGAAAERDLAAKRVGLADARVELRKAQAISDLDEEGLPDIDVDAYESALERAEMAVTMAEIDLQAWEQKAQAQMALVERRAEGTPEELRSSWESTHAMEASNKEARKERELLREQDLERQRKEE